MCDYIDYGFYEEREMIREGNRKVLNWINDFFSVFAGYEKRVSGNADDPYEPLRLTFHAGYCWHFAHILKNTFGRGEVCWAAPFSHFVWVDEDGTPYDCEGFYVGEAFYFIPEYCMNDDEISNFRHIREQETNYRTKTQLINRVKSYCHLTGEQYDPKIESYFKD